MNRIILVTTTGLMLNGFLLKNIYNNLLTMVMDLCGICIFDYQNNHMFRRLTCALFLFTSLITGCTHEMNKNEADRSLKVLNSNLVNLFTNASDKQELKALQFLLNEPSSPIYFTPQRSLFSPDTISEYLINSKGVFQWNTAKGIFEKKDKADIINLMFPLDGKLLDTANFIMSDFESSYFKSHPNFPVKIDAKILIEGKEKLKILHEASIEDNLPKELKSSIDGDDYSAKLALVRTRNDKSGTVQVYFDISSGSFTVCTADIKANIEYTKDGYYFTYFDFEINLFDHQIKGKIDYAKIDPTAGNYIGLFNKYSEIIITEGYSKKVANIVLGLSGDGELLDYFITFNNEEKILFSDYIPLIKKVLNYKY